MVTSVTPKQGITTQIVTGLQSVTVANGGVNGGIIANPSSNVAQGIVNAESLFIDPVGNCAPIGGVLYAVGTIYEIVPGGVWNLIPGQTTPTRVNSSTSGHKFSITIW